MKKSFFMLLMGALTFQYANCQPTHKFTIHGSTNNDYQGLLYLSYGDHTDSVEVMNNSFLFTGSVKHPIEARIHLQNGFFMGDLYLENKPMTLSVSIKENVTILENLSGNSTELMKQELLAFFETLGNDPDPISKLYAKLDKVITDNPRNQFSGSILSDIAMDPYLSYEQVKSLYQKLDTSVQNRDDLKALDVSLNKLKNIRLGDSFKDFELLDKEGKLINTADYRGKFLLVEFWASWCQPCRESNPKLVKIYHRFKEKGFEIYGVSLDTRKDDWKKSIQKDKLDWVNTFVENNWNNEIMKSLGIQYVPSNYLLDKKGKIVALNISENDLESKLLELTQP